MKRDDSQVSAHDDQQVVPSGDFIFEEFGILDGLAGGVYRAGANDHEYALVLPGKDACGVVAGGGDGELRRFGGGNFVPEQSGLDEGVILAKDV